MWSSIALRYFSTLRGRSCVCDESHLSPYSYSVTRLGATRSPQRILERMSSSAATATLRLSLFIVHRLLPVESV